MKKKFLFMSVMASLFLAGCSQEEIAPKSEDGASKEPQFLSVSINTSGVGTRADIEGDYEAGTGLENTVSNVRFYFFAANGDAAPVKKEKDKESWVNYYEVIPEDTKKNDLENVEKIFTATLIIQTKEKDKVPSTIVAVVNPTTDIKIKKEDGTLLGFYDLNAIIQNFSNTSTSAFLMSNSVYAKNSAKMEAVSVEDHLYPSERAALADPVIIHVERVLAKTRLTVGVHKVEGKDYYKTSTDASQKYDNKEIFVKFLGWNVTATVATSRLMKEINPGWSSTLFSQTLLWNTADYYRSFWAVNPAEGVMTYNYGPFNTTDNKFAANAILYFDKGTEEKPTKNYTYLQENASDDYSNGTNPKNPSQVIIAAQLVDADGNAMEFAEYAGERTTVEKLNIKYASLAGLWKNKADGSGKEEIKASDIMLKTATEAGKANQSTPGRYKVYAQLSEAAEKISWYESNASGAKPIYDPNSEDESLKDKENVNGKLEALGGAKVWKDGYTYYYFDIRHLNGAATSESAKGKYGVVRNHVYDAEIKNLVGLGTPVYNPDEIIYPEKPGNDESFLAAQIKVLSWRIVGQEIKLEW